MVGWLCGGWGCGKLGFVDCGVGGEEGRVGGSIVWILIRDLGLDLDLVIWGKGGWGRGRVRRRDGMGEEYCARRRAVGGC